MSRPTILDYKNILNLWFSYRNEKKIVNINLVMFF